MRRFTALALLVLPLAGCAAADATVTPQTADELVAAQLSEVQDWRQTWSDSGCAAHDPWAQTCGVQVLEASFVASTATMAFDRTLYPTVIDELSDDQRNALLPAIKAADETLQETQYWQHISCEQSPGACLEVGAATARHMDEPATELAALSLA